MVLRRGQRRLTMIPWTTGSIHTRAELLVAFRRAYGLWRDAASRLTARAFAVLHEWRRREWGFPRAPNTTSGETPSRARVVSLINLKGGVAKTTTTVALAETLASCFGKRVLVIDLDPQTNATVMLIGDRRWKELNEHGATLATLFKGAVERGGPSFDLDRTLQKQVSDVKGAELVDLLPSSLDLIDVQDRLANAPMGRCSAMKPVDLLRKAVNNRLGGYDLVLIDCPPNLGVITLNGLRLSEGYIIPTIPDVLSTYGIPQIMERVRRFSRDIGETIKPIGIVITKYQADSTTHRNGAERLRQDRRYTVFRNEIRQANQLAAAAEWQEERRTLKQKYGYGGLADCYIELARELLDRLEISHDCPSP